MNALTPNLRMTRPHNVSEAIVAKQGAEASHFIAGGTDLLVNLRRGIQAPELLIDLSGIDELNGIDIGDSGVRIGAGVTIAKLAQHQVIKSKYRAVSEAAEQVAGPSHRVMGTIGGNLCLDTRCIYYNQSEWWRAANQFCLKHRGTTCHVAPQGQRCHAAFTGDLAPTLMVLGSEVELANASGRRRIPLEELYTEDGRAHLNLAKDELLIAVHLPPEPPGSAYAKARVRGSIDYPLAGVAVALRATAGEFSFLRIALTGTNSRPFVLANTDALMGRTIDDNALRDIDRLVQKQVQPMRTTVTSAHYRRLVAAALARRLTMKLSQQSPI
jgi:4-hydroxybenzoyl-CoA reductase subunit beta